MPKNRQFTSGEQWSYEKRAARRGFRTKGFYEALSNLKTGCAKCGLIVGSNPFPPKFQKLFPRFVLFDFQGSTPLRTY